MDQTPTTTGGRPFGIAFFVVVAAAVGFAILLRETVRLPTSMGRPAPKIRAEAWLNGAGPTDDELKGKVIVVDAWAYWCGPCRRDAPAMVELHKRYRDQGVIFIGLTSEGKNAEAQSVEFLKATGITWLNGIGADGTLRDLNCHAIPQKWVFDRKSMIAWDEGSPETIEAAIDRALKESS